MGAGSPVAAPSWTELLLTDPDALGRLGEGLGPVAWPPGSDNKIVETRERALAALAVAFARNLDSARAMAERMEPATGARLLEMTRLAACTVNPGEPSAVRSELKRLLAGDRNG